MVVVTVPQSFASDMVVRKFLRKLSEISSSPSGRLRASDMLRAADTIVSEMPLSVGKRIWCVLGPSSSPIIIHIVYAIDPKAYKAECLFTVSSSSPPFVKTKESPPVSTKLADIVCLPLMPPWVADVLVSS